MEVLVKNEQKLFTLNHKALRQRLEVIRRVLRSEDDWFSIAFIRDERMRALNSRYRGEDETTDVLAFPPADFFPAPGEQKERKTFLGEVVICVDEVLRQAQVESVDYGVLADRLLVHGLLHLKGYDHYTKSELARMSQEEKRMACLLEGEWLSRQTPGNP
ncbi:MAG: rRNA maturation RNase YbeY [Nitrospinae bacterium]|nr:rRNA maturation RNase YbeY [Nitrospinota bacterium]